MRSPAALIYPIFFETRPGEGVPRTAYNALGPTPRRRRTAAARPPMTHENHAIQMNIYNHSRALLASLKHTHTHTPTDSLTHSLTDSLTHSLTH